MLRRGWFWFMSVTLAAVASSAAEPASSQPAPEGPAGPEARPAALAKVEPQLPAVTDSFLTPLPPPRTMLGTWQEAWAITRSKSTALQGARTRLKRSRGERTAAWMRALPTLTAVGTATDDLLHGEGPALGASEPVRLPDPVAYWTASLELRVPVLAAQNWLEVGGTYDSVRSATFEQANMQRAEVARLALAMMNVVTTEQLADVSRVSLRAALATRELTERRAALGGVGKVDVLRVQQEAATSRAQVVAANEAVLRAREALGDALGTSEPVGVRPELRMDGILAEISRQCTRQRSVDERSDILASAATVSAARQRSEAARYALVPTLEGVSKASYYSDEVASPNREHVAWRIGAVLTWRILDGGVRVLDSATRDAELSLAEQNARDVSRHARTELAQALRSVGVADANLEISRTNLELSRETARLTRLNYTEGSGTSLDLVDASRRLREAELDHALKEFEVLRARVGAFLAAASCQS